MVVDAMKMVQKVVREQILVSRPLLLTMKGNLRMVIEGVQIVLLDQRDLKAREMIVVLLRRLHVNKI